MQLVDVERARSWERLGQLLGSVHWRLLMKQASCLKLKDKGDYTIHHMKISYIAGGLVASTSAGVILIEGFGAAKRVSH